MQEIDCSVPAGFFSGPAPSMASVLRAGSPGFLCRP